jgi:transcriptional regulator with XRE-family HTH domain
MGDELLHGQDAVENVKEVNHEMIALARGSRGLTQEELADALSFSQSKMSKYEHGLIAVSPEDLEKLSAFLEFPAEFFLQRDDVVGFGSCCAYHRKQKSLPAKELAVIHDKINVYGLHISKLLTAVTIESHNAFPRMDIDEYHGSAETIAQLVRGAWGLPLGPVRNLAKENAAAVFCES